MNTQSPTVTIVVPAKNEAANLREVLPLLPLDYEIVLVDGNSVDGTVEVALELRPDVRVVHQTRKGKGNALAAGFLAASPKPPDQVQPPKDHRIFRFGCSFLSLSSWLKLPRSGWSQVSALPSTLWSAV